MAAGHPIHNVMLRRTKIILFPAVLIIGIGLVLHATDGDRLLMLEKAGQLPQDASPVDRQLVEHTSWWGKPIDSNKFWKGKTIWLDINARRAANKLGRFYPPIPFGETKYSLYSEKDISGGTGGSESGSTDYHMNDREVAFWSEFERTHPTPPEEIERKQVQIEGKILASRNWIGISQNDINDTIAIEKERAISLNYPPEALADDALHCAYMVHQSQQYQQDIQRMPIEVVQAVAHNSGTDLTQLTNSLSAAQIKAANAWKVAYLQRLQKEKVDKSYIDAYLQAWNLPATEVFGQSK